jgi:hypothetical protein
MMKVKISVFSRIGKSMSNLCRNIIIDDNGCSPNFSYKWDVDQRLLCHLLKVFRGYLQAILPQQRYGRCTFEMYHREMCLL